MVPAMLLLVVAVFVIMGRWLRAKSDLEQLPRTAPTFFTIGIQRTQRRSWLARGGMTIPFRSIRPKPI